MKPKMQLSPGNYVSDAYRAEINKWMIDFFGYEDDAPTIAPVVYHDAEIKGSPPVVKAPKKTPRRNKSKTQVQPDIETFQGLLEGLDAGRLVEEGNVGVHCSDDVIRTDCHVRVRRNVSGEANSLKLRFQDSARVRADFASYKGVARAKEHLSALIGRRLACLIFERDSDLRAEISRRKLNCRFKWMLIPFGLAGLKCLNCLVVTEQLFHAI